MIAILKISKKNKNPFGKVPVLETRDGPIWESGAIQRYVGGIRSDTGLYGNSFYEHGLIDQWLDFVTTEFDPIRNAWIYPLEGHLSFDNETYAHAKKDMTALLNVVNAHLLYHTYLVGNRVTLADIALASSLVSLYQKVFDPNFIAPFGNVTRWFVTLIHQPEFAKHLGKIEFAREEQQAPKNAIQIEEKEAAPACDEKETKKSKKKSKGKAKEDKEKEVEKPAEPVKEKEKEKSSKGKSKSDKVDPQPEAVVPTPEPDKKDKKKAI